MKGSNTSFWSPYFLRPRKKFRHLCRIIVIEFKFFSEAFPRRCFVNNAFLKISSNFIRKHLCRSFFFIPVNLAKFFNNTFFTKHFQVTAFAGSPCTYSPSDCPSDNSSSGTANRQRDGGYAQAKENPIQVITELN